MHEFHPHYHVLLNTNFHGNLTIDSRALHISRHSTLSSCYGTKFSPGQTFCIFGSNDFKKRASFIQCYIIAQTGESPNAKHAVSHEAFPLSIREVEADSFDELYFSRSKNFAVHYKSSID